MKILINGYNSKTGGGKSILNNYLKLLSETGGPHQYVVIVPDVDFYKTYECSFIQIVGVSNKFISPLLLPITYNILIPKYAKGRDINVIFNLADIPIKSNIKQLFLFDWAYAVYPESIAWKRMNKKDLLMKQLYFPKAIFYLKKNKKTIKNMIIFTFV